MLLTYRFQVGRSIEYSAEKVIRGQHPHLCIYAPFFFLLFFFNNKEKNASSLSSIHSIHHQDFCWLIFCPATFLSEYSLSPLSSVQVINDSSQWGMEHLSKTMLSEKPRRKRKNPQHILAGRSISARGDERRKRRRRRRKKRRLLPLPKHAYSCPTSVDPEPTGVDGKRMLHQARKKAQISRC